MPLAIPLHLSDVHPLTGRALTRRTTQTIRAALSRSDSPVVHPKPDRINNACYEMALGNEAFITSSHEHTKEYFGSRQQVHIPPGQLALLITEEELRIPTAAVSPQ